MLNSVNGSKVGIRLVHRQAYGLGHDCAPQSLSGAGGRTLCGSRHRLGMWVEAHARDTQGPGGYTGGYEGWEPAPERMTWKSTEHNLDLYVAFRTLADLTGDATWQERALHARHFLLAMWQAYGPHHFATGTHPDSVTPNCDFAPSDVNTWGLMALQDEAATYGAGVDWVQTNARVTKRASPPSQIRWPRG